MVRHHSRRHRWFGLVIALVLLGCFYLVVVRALQDGTDVLGCTWSRGGAGAECDDG